MAIKELYSALSILDRGVVRTKKSPTEYVQSKFGGDIRIGAVIMLEAISDELTDSEGTSNYEETVAQASYLRRVINYLADNADRIDLLPSLADPSKADNIQVILPFYSSLQTPVVTTQSQLYDTTKGEAMHYMCSATELAYAPLSLCKFAKVFNGSIATTLKDNYTAMSAVANSPFYRINPGNILTGATPAEVSKGLKSK